MAETEHWGSLASQPPKTTVMDFEFSERPCLKEIRWSVPEQDTQCPPLASAHAPGTHLHNTHPAQAFLF